MLKALIHVVTSNLPNRVHVALSDLYARHALPYLFRKMGVKCALEQFFFQKYTGKKAHARRLKTLEQIRSKEKITIVFQVWSREKWKCELLYREMEKHPRFNPVIWLMGAPGESAETRQRTVQRLSEFFSNKSYRITTAHSWDELDAEVDSDLIFIQEPYIQPINLPPAVEGRLLCYIRYGVSNTITRKGTDWFLHNYAVFYFIENRSVAAECSKLMLNRGRNMVVTGHPVMDEANQMGKEEQSVWKRTKCPCKKVIWAPHWSIEGSSFFSTSTFLKTHDAMLRLAREFEGRIQFAFKPHPLLYQALCRYPGWGKKRTDEYYKMWENMSNTQLVEGGYLALFNQSDALIHDCGSFISEYIRQQKPCMYLQYGIGYPHFNNMSKAALKLHRIAQSEDDIKHFLEYVERGAANQVISAGQSFIEEYLTPPNGKSAVQNIIDVILGQETSGS